MLKSLNSKIIGIGFVSMAIWGFVSMISKGIPRLWCELIDKMTFHVATTEVFKMANGFYYQVDNDAMPTLVFMGLFFLLTLMFFYLILQIEKQPAEPRSLIYIFAFAVIFRVLLLPSQPIHENDFYRYLWDGKSIKNKINPYKYAPSDLFMYEYGYREDYYDTHNGVLLKAREFDAADQQRLNRLIQLRDQNMLFYDRIGHWQVPTIYPPVAQGVFYISSLLRQDSFIFMKFCFMLFDIGVILTTIALLKQFRMNPCMVMIYAWSPLVLKEFPNSGHYDPIPIFFTMLSILLLFQKRYRPSYWVLALATLSKFFSGILLPLFKRETGWRPTAIFFGAILLFYLPFVLWGQTSVSEIFQGLVTYNEEWAYNASIFAVVYYILDFIKPALTESLIPAKMIVGGLFLGILIYLMTLKEQGRLELLHRLFIAIAALFIINPVGDPWYFCWCIPFLCFFPYRSWILLSALLILSYLNFQSYHPITELKFLKISVLNWVTYLPFFFVLLWEMWRQPKYIQLSNE